MVPMHSLRLTMQAFFLQDLGIKEVSTLKTVFYISICVSRNNKKIKCKKWIYDQRSWEKIWGMGLQPLKHVFMAVGIGRGGWPVALSGNYFSRFYYEIKLNLYSYSTLIT